MARVKQQSEETPAPTRRDRAHEQTKTEIKELAYGQIADAGLGGLSLNGIAREMGVTGPALYRYYASRDDLITDLLGESYEAWGQVSFDAASRAGGSAKHRLFAAARALRAWAKAHPERYDLLFGRPLPGYEAPPERTLAPARQSLDALAALLAAHRGISPTSLAAREAAVLVWSRLHGFLSLELGGHFDDLDLDVDRLFERDLRAMLAP